MCSGPLHTYAPAASAGDLRLGNQPCRKALDWEYATSHQFRDIVCPAVNPRQGLLIWPRVDTSTRYNIKYRQGNRKIFYFGEPMAGNVIWLRVDTSTRYNIKYGQRIGICCMFPQKPLIRKYATSHQFRDILWPEVNSRLVTVIWPRVDAGTQYNIEY